MAPSGPGLSDGGSKVSPVSLDNISTLMSLGVSPLSLVVAVTAARWGWRADRRAAAAEGLTVRLLAVADLADGLHNLRRLARQADVASVAADQIAAVMVDFEDRAHRHTAVLPTHLRAVERNVRTAMGNCFGAPALTAWDPHLARHEVATFDRYWWDITRTYLDHVDTCLQDWRTAPERRPLTELSQFHAWRKDEDAAYFTTA